MMKEGAVQFG